MAAMGRVQAPQVRRRITAQQPLARQVTTVVTAQPMAPALHLQHLVIQGHTVAVRQRRLVVPVADFARNKTAL